MSEFKITKGDKYFRLSYFDNGKPKDGRGVFLNTEGGEGMELNETDFYDHIKKYFDEKM